MKKALYAGLLAGTTLLMPASSMAQTSSILDDPTIRQLQDQDIDANRELLDALIRSAKQGPIFKISPERVVVDMIAGARGSASIRVTNAGDQDGEISGINLLGSVPELEMTTSCDEILPRGDYCEITLVLETDTAQVANTAVIGTINQRNKSNFQVPVTITVNPKPEPVKEPEPAPVIVQREPVQQGPVPRDIAREYFRIAGPIGRGMSSSRGFTIISASKDPSSSTEVAGVRYQDIDVRTVTTDERYDEEIPYTDASLPVDRDRILTTDRVIKAVLETPVSNVMCNKVVALVESDVYSATSAYPLIQAGSRVVGQCQDFVDERVGIAWSRIITTDGRSIYFQDKIADTHDATGLGGVPGRIYMSPFDKYVLPIFSTMIDTTAGVIYAYFGDDEEVVTDDYGNVSSETSATNEGLTIVTSDARETAQELIEDIRDTREVAVIPKGSRIDIEIQEDIYFREDRKVVALADMRFDIDDMKVGEAARDLPSELILVPVSSNYSGATVTVNGRRYKIEEAPESASLRNDKDSVIPEISRQTMDDLAAPQPEKE